MYFGTVLRLPQNLPISGEWSSLPSLNSMKSYFVDEGDDIPEGGQETSIMVKVRLM